MSSTRKVAFIIIEVLCLLVKMLSLNVIAFYRTFIRPISRKCVDNKIILITGGGGSLGKEMALCFAKLGAVLVLWDINEIAAEKVARQIEHGGGKACFYKCDVSNEQDIAEVAKKVHKEVGEVDILINNAGVFNCKSLLEMNSYQIEKTIKINLLAHYWTIRQFLPRMLQRKSGQIVAISSVAGQHGSVYMVDYCGSKFGVIGMMAALEEELHLLYNDHNIQLTVLLPSAFEDGLVKKTTTRSQLLAPVLTLKRTALLAVDAILRNEDKTTLPQRLGIFFKYASLFVSHSAEKEAQRFCECKPQRHD